MLYSLGEKREGTAPYGLDGYVDGVVNGDDDDDDDDNGDDDDDDDDDSET